MERRKKDEESDILVNGGYPHLGAWHDPGLCAAYGDDGTWIRVSAGPRAELLPLLRKVPRPGRWLWHDGTWLRLWSRYDGPGYGYGPQYQQPQQPLEEKDAKQMVENYVRSTRNPNLKVGNITDKDSYFEVEILTKDGSLADKLAVDKRTGWAAFDLLSQRAPRNTGNSRSAFGASSQPPT
jgi:hypothetical protein